MDDRTVAAETPDRVARVRNEGGAEWSRLAEPAAAATSLLVGVAALACASATWRAMAIWEEEWSELFAVVAPNAVEQLDAAVLLRWLPSWLVAFVALGLAALLGAVFHSHSFERARSRSWITRGITLLIAVSAAFVWSAMLAAGLADAVRGLPNTQADLGAMVGVSDYPHVALPDRPLYPLLAALGGAKLLLMLLNTLRRPRPRLGWSMLDLVASLLAVLVAVALASEPGGGLTSSARSTLPWLAGGVGLAAAATSVQLWRIAPHPRFDHNALCYVLLLPALWLLLEGALRAVGA